MGINHVSFPMMDERGTEGGKLKAWNLFAIVDF